MERAAALLARWGYLGLFAILGAEEAGLPLPVPGDLFIAAMGAAAHTGGASFLPTAGVVVAATLCGTAVLFTLARHGGRRLLMKVARRFGYTEERNAKIERWLAERGAIVIVAGRLTPGLRIVMTVVAGSLGMSRAKFTGATAVAAALWAAIYFWLGYALGAGAEKLEPRLPVKGWVLALCVIGLAALAWLGVHLWRRRALPRE